jgi:segregation and condensation protein A
MSRRAWPGGDQPRRSFIAFDSLRMPPLTTTEQHDYQVELDMFRGPLDLLLYLVKREEVDIRDIPIARVAEQFKEYLELMHFVNVEVAGDFLVMAATLMEIKSRMVLPRTEELAEPEDDPRQELVRQLLQYKKFKEAAAVLEARAEEQSQRLSRQPPPLPATANTPVVRAVELWDLVSAFGRLMRETMALQPQSIVVDQTPLQVYMDQIVQRLQREGRVKLSDLFTPPYTRGRLVGLFLAVLELTKARTILPEQELPFDDIWLSLQPLPS